MNFLNLKDKALVHLGRPLPDVRTNFHLFNRLPEVAADSGWEVVILWDQNAPYPYFEMTENLKILNDYACMMDKDLIEYTEQIINQTFKDKKILNFQAQLAILRKKWSNRSIMYFNTVIYIYTLVRLDAIIHYSLNALCMSKS